MGTQNRRLYTLREVRRSNEPLHIVFLVSRNKDNRNIDNFIVRTRTFLTTHGSDNDALLKELDYFALQGQPGEMSRLYISVNPRKPKDVIGGLQHYLIDNPDVNPASLPSLVASIARRKEYAADNKRMFDVDFKDLTKLDTFLSELTHRGLELSEIMVKATPNGYVVVTPRGADLRGLVDTMPEVPLENKRDKGPWLFSAEEIGYKPDDMMFYAATIKGA